MKTLLSVGAVALTIASATATADSFLRIKCDDQDIGAEIFLDGKFVGECPVDAPAPEGTVQLRARKLVNGGDYEQVFEKRLRVIEGVPQRIQVVMSAPQLTAEAKQRQDASEANTQLRAAQGGSIPAMRTIADYYARGFGVERNPAEASAWEHKADAATVQQDYRAASAGDIAAMDRMVTSYETGKGIAKNPEQANLWRAKAQAAREKQAVIELARAKEQRRREEEAALANRMLRRTHTIPTF